MVSTGDTEISLHIRSPGGGGGILQSNTESAKICLNFNFRGEGGGALWSEIPERGFLENLDKNLLFEVNCTETCLCITDSLSHTTYVETNDVLGTQIHWQIQGVLVMHGPISFIWMQFLAKILPNNMFLPETEGLVLPIWEMLDPPLKLLFHLCMPLMCTGKWAYIRMSHTMVS